ncbi:surface antigen BspA-like [Trichomonas vaginalis G3]|uniref:Surface antigen BspA-like n=1 Tax=Trichomonas vaginalis (strain ATCC PRA-98 / G3) TaxID=412133 RepID=A2FZ38_TRIV3|nr:regulation of response to stimulus [Trichomonas vaginalis G3]EAX89828.1 surface antigen BspA-like [Trichomonas vaginalis G3]KAI5538194.1 regulation of response to stimulus [Trichomonas vaginalis G3]|eukprot:XP_001302758.1 surface antigen BspA-like [Trichomonas vaginalis G3]
MSSIYVDTLNEYFWSDDKAIYTKDKTTIVYCASYIGDSYTILPTVTKINEGCFINCKCTEIIIPTSITEIQRYAFSNSKITSIQIPPNVTVIPYACFAGTNLQSVIIPNNVTSIEASAFASCNLLTYICVPESVDKLGGGCFPSNSNLVLNVSEKSEINIDRQLLVISKDNTSLIQSMSTIPNIVIPSKVKLIKLNAFFGNTNLETVTFDGDSQFEKVEGSAFADCKKLRMFEFGSKLQIISNNAFKNCPLPISISFPSSLLKIDINAFLNTKLTQITFNSDSDLEIGDTAFANCIMIDQILFLNKGTISLGTNCFGGLTKLKSIQIPRTITTVGTSCFSGSAIDRVAFDQNQISFSSLPASIFKDCTYLTTFTIPSNCVSLGAECLSKTGITSIDIPDSVTILGIQCFKDCSNLKSIVIRSTSNLERIDVGVFEGCYKFSDVSSFDSPNFVSESSAIYSHDKSHMYVYPPASPRLYFSLLEGVEHIESGAFSGCANVQVITIPDGHIKSIGENAFRGCINLRQITLPSSIKSIGVGAFTNCPLLTCGIIIQNSTSSFIQILKKSGLDVKSQFYCSRFSCRQNSIYSPSIPISFFVVFISI